MTSRGNGAAKAQGASDLVEQGRMLHRAGRLDEAEQIYRRALVQDPVNAEAHELLAVIAGQRGRLDEAVAGFRRALDIAAPTAERYCNLAEAHRLAGDFNAALAAYNKAIEVDPEFLDAYRDCADAAKDEAARATAAGSANAAGGLNKLAAHYLTGLGHALMRRGSVAEAETAYRGALVLEPESADLFNILGVLALQGDRPIEAEQLIRQALALDPKSPRALNNLGRALLWQVRLDEAAQAFEAALELQPDFAEARINRGRGMLPILNYRSDLTPKTIFEAHRDWGLVTMARLRAEGRDRVPAFPNRPDPDRKLRVGYVSPDFRKHSVAYFFEPLLEAHDRATFEVFCYAEVSFADDTTRRLQAMAPHWQFVAGIKDADLQRQIRADGIDILVELAGHTANTRIDAFAPKPAPVTLAWLGYPTTSGLPTIDYRITDGVADPPGEADRLHTETLVRLPNGFLCYRPPAEAPEVAPLPCREGGAITFGSFNHPLKMGRPVVELWSRLLHACPGSRLLLKGGAFADEALVRSFHAGFAHQGIAAGRVIIKPPVASITDHLAAYSEVDIALDPFPYNDATATCEALWMGVPVVTLHGDRHAGRVGASLLTQTDLADLIAPTPERYVEQALALVVLQNRERLASLRTGMRDRLRNSPLCDEAGFARALETAFRTMWSRWCASVA